MRTRAGIRGGRAEPRAAHRLKSEHERASYALKFGAILALVALFLGLL